MDTNKRFYTYIKIIINPSARSGRGQAVLQDLLRADPQLQAACVISRSPQHFCDLLHAAQEQAPASGEPGVLGIAGGDGTVTLAVQALRQLQERSGRPQRVPLCVLPTGSGNDFANDLCGQRSVTKALLLLRHGQPRWVDVGEAQTLSGSAQAFCCVASVGLDEHALRVIHGSRLPRSMALNVYAALRALWQYQPQTVSIDWPGGSYAGPISFCAVTNTRSYGGGFRISPAARIDDGLLDLCIVPAWPKTALLRRFPRILRGTHGSLPGIVQAQVPWVRITPRSSPKLPLCMDGELPSSDAPVELRVAKARLLVVAPTAATVPNQAATPPTAATSATTFTAATTSSAATTSTAATTSAAATTSTAATEISLRVAPNKKEAA